MKQQQIIQRIVLMLFMTLSVASCNIENVLDVRGTVWEYIERGQHEEFSITLMFRSNGQVEYIESITQRGTTHVKTTIGTYAEIYEPSIEHYVEMAFNFGKGIEIIYGDIDRDRRMHVTVNGKNFVFYLI